MMYSSRSRNTIEPEYEDVFNTWQTDPTPVAAGTLLRKVDPVINMAIKSYAADDKSPLIRGRAKRLALDAIKSYDPKKAGLRTHLMQNLQRLSRVRQDQNNFIRVPEQKALDGFHLNRISTELEDELGYEPSDIEIADRLGWPLKRIGSARGLPHTINESNTAFQDEEGNIGAPASSAFDQRRMAAWRGYVYHGLDDIDKTIMELSTGMNGKTALSNGEIAKRMKLSPGAISQRTAKIQSKINSFYEAGVF